MTESNIQMNNSSYSKFTNYFTQKELGLYLEKFLEEKADKIIQDLNISYEKGDLKNCNEIIQKINDNRLFKIFSSEKKIILLDIIIKKIFPNLLCNSNIILNFLTKIRFMIPKNYVIDRKFFYSLYYILYQKYKHEIHNYIPLFKFLHKLIPENSFSLNDYNNIKKTFLEELNKTNKSYAISIFIYFIPKKFIEKDDEMQYKLFLLFKNSKNNFIGNCCMFSKILKKNGNLFFSQNPSKNDDLIKIFIRYFFTNLNLYIMQSDSVKNSNYTSPVFHNNEKNKKKNKFDHCVIDTLLYLLFNQNLEKYSEFIFDNLKLILNNKHLLLKEKCNTDSGKNFIKFMNEFIYRLSNIFYEKKFEEKIFKKISYEIDYESNQYIFTKLLDILEIFQVTFIKLFLYENEGTLNSLQKLFKLLGNIKEKNYIEKILEKINFEEYIKILKFFEENIETKSVKFITKLQSILPLLLSPLIYSSDNKVRELVKNLISLTADSISSANIEFDVNIIIMYSTYFFDIKNKNKEHKIFDDLIPLITDGCNKIMNNIIGFLDFICIKNNLEFCVFVNEMRMFLDENNKKNISKKYADYIQSYEIENKYLKYYFNVIEKNEHQVIFNYVYNNVLYVDDDNDVKIKEYFLYNLEDDEYKINVKKCEIEIFEKQIEKYQTILSLLDYSKLLTSEKNIKHYYQLFYALINKEETNFKRLGIALFESALNSFLNSKIKDDSDLDINIEYPSKDNIILISNIYKKLVLPYENYILKNILNTNSKEKLSKKNEQILLIYTMLINVINTTKINFILLLSENKEESELIKEKMNKELYQVYQEYNNLITNSENVIEKIYEFNKINDNVILDNQNIKSFFDKIILNKLMMNNDKINNKKNQLKGKKSFLYKYYNLKNIKNYWLKKKIKVMNYNYFNILKNFIPKNNFYYQCLYIYCNDLSSNNIKSNVITNFNNYLYALNKDKIKEIYEQIFSEYKNELLEIKEESETEKNKMKNISEIFIDFSFIYIYLFPKDIIFCLYKLITIIVLLKIKKFNSFDKIIRKILMSIKKIIYLPLYSEKDYNKLYYKYIQTNDIIYNYFKEKIIINDKIKAENKKYYEIIKQIIDKVLQVLNEENNNIINIFLNSELINKKYNINNIIDEHEKMFIIFRLKEHIKDTLNIEDDLYYKIIKFIFNIIFDKFIPVSSKIMWIKILHSFIKEEYNNYKKYIFINYESNEDFNKSWESLKYKLKGKKKKNILPVYTQKLRLSEFKYESNNNKISYYNIDVEKFIEIMMQVDDWLEEKNLIFKEDKRFNKFKEIMQKYADIEDNISLDIKMVKLFYYMLELKYIDYNDNDFIKKFKLSNYDDKEKNGKKLSSVLYEFMLAKYYYMFNNNLFNLETKKEFWEIMNYYSNGINKKEDEKIIMFFKYLFNICSLENLLLIFGEINLEQNPIDFTVKLYNFYLTNFINIKSDKNILEINSTQNLINEIMTNDEYLIKYTSDLKHIIKYYFYINNIIKYDYDLFQEKYDKKELKNFINILITKDFSKRSRYALYDIYTTFFNGINDINEKDDFIIFNNIIKKIALCATEFKDDLGNKIEQNIENKFKCYNELINFKKLCDNIEDILIQEDEMINDSNKLIYLQIINMSFNSQKFFNLGKCTSEDIFNNLFKIFKLIKTENLKIKFSSVFASFFNDLSENANKNFIEKYENIILKEENEQDNKNYMFILMAQLLRFRMSLPLYIQEFIIKLKDISKKKKEMKNIINTMLKIAMDNYHGSFVYMKENISIKCKNILEEMTMEKSYFV